MLWLALTTSTRRGSVALVEDGSLLAEAPYEDLRGHAERVVGSIDRVFADAGRSRDALSAVACDVGPGSFTGVRVGVSLAKGIALGLDVPAVGVLSLETMAAATFGTNRAVDGDAVVAVLDAKKGEVFLAAFARSGVAIKKPQHVAREAAWGAVADVADAWNLVVVGEIAAELGALSPHLVRDSELDLPDAAWVARVGERRWSGANDRGTRPPGGYDSAVLEPVYVRAPDAKPAR